MKVGIIPPGYNDGEIKVRDEDDDPGVFWTAKLESPKTIHRKDYSNFWSYRPRRGRLKNWPKMNKQLKALMKEEELPYEYESYGDEELERICTEFLRNVGLPDGTKLKALTVPHIGKTQERVDIIGLTDSDEDFYIEVTGSDEGVEKKMENLAGLEKGRKLLIAPGSEPETKHNIDYLAVEKVLDLVKSHLGKEFLKKTKPSVKLE